MERNYAYGEIIDNDAGYLVKVGEPVVDIDEKLGAGISELNVGLNPALGSQYLVSLEINGTVSAYRELCEVKTYGTSLAIHVGDYVIDEEGYIEVPAAAHVILRMEPCEVYTTDAFRAAVKKDAPANKIPEVESADKGKFLHANESTGDLEWAEGGSGGGVLVVTDTNDTLDKTWQEIHDAILTTGAVLMHDGNANDALVLSCYATKGDYAVSGNIPDWSATYIASSADGYPTLLELISENPQPKGVMDDSTRYHQDRVCE